MQFSRHVALLVMFLLCLDVPVTSGFLLNRTTPGAEIVGESSIICTARVLGLQSQWKEDDYGTHIHTEVVLWVNEWVKGRSTSPLLMLDVIGGTVDQTTEVVSHTPVFVLGESVLLFLGGSPLQVIGGAQGKIPVIAGQVSWNGRPIMIGSIGRVLGLVQAADPCDAGQDGQAGRADVLPVITEIVPAIASAGTFTDVNIMGTGFGADQGSGKIQFFYKKSRIAAEATISRIEAPVVSWSDTRIVCEVPVGIVDDYDASAGSGPVVVLTGGQQTSKEFPFKVTFGYDQTSWAHGQKEISYYVNENTRDCSDAKPAIEAAGETWNQTGASVKLACSGSHTSTHASRNGRNEVLWGRMPLDRSYSRAIAVSFTWVSQGHFAECDIVFNDPDYLWSTDVTPKAGTMDVVTVTLHEMGHWLGLRDIYGDSGDKEYDSAKVMYGFGSAGQIKRVLHPDDVAGVQYVYPPTVAPASPDSIDAQPDPESGQAKVTWGRCVQASSYQLERSIDGGISWAAVYTGPHTYQVETGLGVGNYQYRVRASNIAGASDWLVGTWHYAVVDPPQEVIAGP